MLYIYNNISAVKLDSYVYFGWLSNGNLDTASETVFLDLGINLNSVPYYPIINLHRNTLLVWKFL